MLLGVQLQKGQEREILNEWTSGTISRLSFSVLSWQASRFPKTFLLYFRNGTMSIVDAQLVDYCGFTIANILSCLDVYIVRIYYIS